MSALSLTLYTNPQSRGRIARWMLEEVGVPYEEEILTFQGTMKSDAYLALNPMGKVPTVVHNGKIVTECAAICAYLADAFPEAGLAPAAKDRAEYYRWLFFAAGPVEAAVVNRALGFEVPAEREGTVGYGNFDRVVDTLAKAVVRAPYLVGGRFSAADVYVGSQVGWGIQFGTLPKRPEFVDYWGGLSDRPALKRANEKDDKIAPLR